MAERLMIEDLNLVPSLPPPLKKNVNDCLWKKYFASNSPQIPSNLI